MAIYYFDGNQPNPPNYIGIRVNVMVAGKVKQRWFNFRYKYKTNEQQIQAAQEAEALNTKWLQEKKMHRFMKIDDYAHKQKTPYATGVRGISMKFVRNAKQENGNPSNSYRPCFIVQIAGTKTRGNKVYNINKLGHQLAWQKACAYIADIKGLTSFDKFLKRKPDINQFLNIIFIQRQKGMQIPTKYLPKELLKALLESNCDTSKTILNNLLLDGEDINTLLLTKKKTGITA